MQTMGVYEIVNTVNNKVYVGSSICVERRWNDHKLALCKGQHHSTHLQRAYNKYGVSAFIYRIEVVTDPNELLQRELYWLRNKSACDHRRGYNMHDSVNGFPLGKKHTAKTKRKMSEKAKGRKHSPETKHKIGNASVEHWKDPTYKKRFIQGQKRYWTKNKRQQHGDDMKVRWQGLTTEQRERHKQGIREAIYNKKGIEYNGQKKSLQEWSKELDINSSTLSMRLTKYGWSIERAFTTPARAWGRA